HLVRALAVAGHTVAVFHRGQTTADLPSSVVRIQGDRQHLSAFRSEFSRFAPQVVIDLIAYREQEALDLVRVFRGIARRIVVLSSMDVYRAYGCLRRTDVGPPEPGPMTEDAPLRETLYPYRAQANGPDDLLYHYEKILVERVVMGSADLPGTVLRLAAVYGPGDRHRTFEYLKRMDDGRPAILLGAQRAGWRWTRGYVENIASAIALAAFSERATGRIYNVGEPTALTEREWVRSTPQAAGWTGSVIAIPDDELPKHLQMPLDWRHDCDGATGRIREELGYHELVPLEEALTRTVAWERAHPPAEVDAGQFDYAAEDAVLARFGQA